MSADLESVGIQMDFGEGEGTKKAALESEEATRKEVEANEQLKGEEDITVHITEAYIGLSVIQWKWPDYLSPWQQNAVIGLLKSQALCHEDHPLRQPGDNGIQLYIVTDNSGIQKTCMSLKQVEYLQYYIHEMRLADPAWILHWAKCNETSTEGVPIDMSSVGPPEYPEGDEWIKLPDAFITPDQIVRVEPVIFNDHRTLSKLINKQRRNNKQLKIGKYVAQPPETMDVRTAALVDNATPGPGLRRGTEKHREKREWRENERAEEDKRLLEEIGLAPKSEIPDLQGDEKKTDGVAEQLNQVDNLATSKDGDADPSDEQSPRPDLVPSPFDHAPRSDNFTTQYYKHAQKALWYASLGGIFAAQRFQEGDSTGKDHKKSEEDSPDLADTPPIGRSLFMSIRLTTWEVDEDVVLEVGWAAVWFQGSAVNSDGATTQDDQIKDVGHIVVQDHLPKKHNGVWKPNESANYLFGESQAIPAKDLKRVLEAKIKDLTAIAGGGPTYILLHSADKEHSALQKIGLKTGDWYSQFRPPSWDYAGYECVDGIGKTFIIDTAIVFAAIEFEPNIRPSPIKSERSLEEIAWMLFGSDEKDRPVACGNAGNDAFYCLRVFLTLMTSRSLEDLRADYRKSQETPAAPRAPRTPTASAATAVALPVMRDTAGSANEGTLAHGQAQETTHSTDEEYLAVVEEAEEDWSDDEMIKGVFTTGDDGIEVRID